MERGGAATGEARQRSVVQPVVGLGAVGLKVRAAEGRRNPEVEEV